MQTHRVNYHFWAGGEFVIEAKDEDDAQSQFEALVKEEHPELSDLGGDVIDCNVEWTKLDT